MSHPILVTGAAGGAQGSTGRRVANLLLEQGIPVRAFVHKLDSRSDELHIDDHKRGAFELGAPTTDVHERNQRTLGNWLREFAQFMIAPLSPGFNLDRYDRELRRPFPSEPQFAPESKVWRREHGITDLARSVASVQTKATSAIL